MSDELCAWFESCPCHPFDFFQHPQPGPEQGRQADYEDEHVCLSQQVRAACEAAAVPSEDFRGCPLAGQRSTDLACGRCFDVLQEVSQRGLADLLRYSHIGGDHEDWQTAYSDFNRGYAQYTSYLTQKLQCWQELPWKFAALNHIDPAQVRLQAQVLVDKLDSSPQQRDLHHRVTWLFLCKDSAGNEALLLRQLRALASGQSLLADPDMLELRRFAQDLRFIPTVERVQEADHSIVKRTVYLRKVSGPYVSTAIRTAEMQNKFRTPSEYHELLQHWPKVLDADEVAQRLGVWRHPLYQQAIAEKHRMSVKRQLLTVLVYRLDPESQFASTKQARRKRDRRARAVKKVKDDFFRQLNPEDFAWSPDNVVRRAAAQRMQDRMEVGRLYSMPPDTVALPSLQARLQSAVRIALPDVPLQSDACHDLDMNAGSHLECVPAVPAERGQRCEQVIPAPDCQEVPVMFFRVNHRAPGRHRTLPLPAASGMNLSQSDMTVTVHSSVQIEDACWVEVAAAKAEGMVSAVSVLSLCKADAVSLPFSLQQWSTCQKLVYSLKGVPPSPELSGLLCCFITKRAFPGASASQDFRVEHSDNSTLTLCRTLQQTRHAECTSDASETASESTWRLTEQGMQNLVPMHEVFRPTPVFDQIDTLLGRVEQGLEAVQDFSTWELLQVLQHRGFTLKQLPAKKKDRRALAPHTVDASRPILYCGSRNSVTLESGQTKAYMQALVLAPELFRGTVILGGPIWFWCAASSEIFFLKF